MKISLHVKKVTALQGAAKSSTYLDGMLDGDASMARVFSFDHDQ